jgi:hypothetical protein
LGLNTVLKLYYAVPGWKNSDPGWKKFGTGIRDNHPGSATPPEIRSISQWQKKYQFFQDIDL